MKNNKFKKIMLLGIFLLSLIFISGSNSYLRIPFLKKNILSHPMKINQNVAYGNGVYKNIEKNKKEKMLYAAVRFKRERDYIIEFNVDSKSGYQATSIFVDFIAPNYDKKEHEIKIDLDFKTKDKKIFVILNTRDIPANSMFRIFYYSPYEVVISNIRLSEISIVGYIVRFSIYLLILLLSVMIFYQVIMIREEIRNKFASIDCKIKKLLFHPLWDNPGFTLALLFLSYFSFSLLRFMLSLLIETPLIPTDELVYKVMAYSYFNTGSFYNTERLGFAVDIPNVLYSWVISVSFFFKENFFTVIKLINSLLMNLSVFPFYLIMREFVSHKKTLFSSILILLLPSLNYINFAMTEVLVFPLFLFCFFFAYKNLASLELKYGVFTGISLSLLMMTKLHAITFIVVFLVVSIIISIVFKKDANKAKKTLLSCGLTLVAFAVSFLLLSAILKGQISFDIGLYKRVVKTGIQKEVFSAKSFSMILAHFSTFFFLYFIPFAVSLLALFRSLKERNFRESVFLLLGLTLFLGLFLWVFKFTADIAVQENFKRLHGRYYFMIYPFFIAVFIIFSEKIDWTFNKKRVVLGSALVITLADIFYFFPKYAYGLAVVDNLDLTWALLINNSLVFTTVTVASLACFLFYLFSKKLSRFPYLFFFIIYSFITNYGEISYSIDVNAPGSKSINNYRSFLKSHIDDFERTVVMILDFESSMGFRLQIPFWLPYNYKGVYGKPKGSIITKDMIPDNTQYVILLDDYDLTDFSTPGTVIHKKNKFSIIALSTKDK